MGNLFVITLVITYLFAPFIAWTHYTVVKEGECLKTNKRSTAFHRTPYIVIALFLWVWLTLILPDPVDGTESLVTKSWLAFIVLAITATMNGMFQSLLIYCMSSTIHKLEEWAFVYTKKRAIRRTYTPHVSALANALIDSGILYRESDRSIGVWRKAKCPQGHPAFKKDVLNFVHLLLDNLDNQDARSIIDGMCVSGERVNQLAFLMTVLQDEEKYALLTKQPNPEFADELNVLRSIVQDAKGRCAQMEALKLRTDLSSQSLRETILKQEMIDLKRGAESLNLT